MEAPVQIRGDPLDQLFADLPYDNLGGQWGGIRFYPESFGNKISYAYVRGMTSGIVLDSCASEEPRLEIANSRIRNSSGNLITSAYSRLNCWNSELSDAGGAILPLTGGIADFNDARDFVLLGADRLGTSRLVEQAKKKGGDLDAEI